ncbi:MAG: NmrA family transcriptional regulator [Sandaracinaceae bacterium]
MSQEMKTVILGGAGKTGRRVASQLAAKSVATRLVSRSTEVPFDWADEQTYRGAVRGATSMYLTYYPDLAMPGAAEQVDAVSRIAVEEGVQRIVLLAGRGEPQVHPAEDAVKQSGAEWSILECAFFAQNFSEGALSPRDGVVAFPAGDIAEPFIDCDDIADVAVAALTEDRHVGQTYELTGPRALGWAEATQAIASASGQPLRYVPVSFEQYAEALAAHMPSPHVEFLVGLFRFLLDGHNTPTADGVERALGRPARDFQTYARGAWS